MRLIILTILCFAGLSNPGFSQDHGDDHTVEMPQGQISEAEKHDDQIQHSECGDAHDGHHAKFDAGAVAFHHISDHNVYSIGPIQIPLPVMVYVKDKGWDFFSSGVFEPDYHGNGKYAYNGFVIYAGQIRRIKDEAFPDGKVELGEHAMFTKEKKDTTFAFAGGQEDTIINKKNHVVHLCYEGKSWEADNKSTLDGGLLKGGLTSFYDFSITKNVASMFLILIFMGWVFISIAKTYKKREGKAPKGLQSFMEPIFLFIQEEVAKPFMGPKWERYFPFILALFFFILGLNLFGQIPFFGNANVTGNLSVTLVLALFAFVVTNVSGNAHYWQHIFWMPGLPAWVKVILTPVEIAGIFIKPLALMLRLFGNITAGHMVIVIFVSLIFIFGESGARPGVAYATSIGSVLLALFMMAIELLVAFIQAFVFAILTASYIGAATEEHHPEEQY